MNMQCAGRETAHTQIYTSNIGSIILEEHGRCEGLGSQPTSTHGAGSSGTKSKKCVVAAACVRVINNTLGNKQPCSTLPSPSSSHELKSSCFIHTPHSKKISKKRLQWNTSCCLRTKRIRKADPLPPRRPARGARHDPAGTRQRGG